MRIRMVVVVSLLLLATLLVVAAMMVSPEISMQIMRVEAFGWQVEVRQGFFVLLVLCVLWLLYLLNASIRLLLLGKGRLWLGFRSGKLNRQERNLRNALMKYVDGDVNSAQRMLEKSGQLLPVWLSAAFQRVAVPVSVLPLPLDDDEDEIGAAVLARIATSRKLMAGVDQPGQRLHLQAWLQVSPDSLLARYRLALLELDEGAWQRAIDLLTALQKHASEMNHLAEATGEGGDVNLLLLRAMLALAEEKPEQCKELLRKMKRIMPDSGPELLRLGQLMHVAEGIKPVKKLWLASLQKYDDELLADACFNLLLDDPLQHYRDVEHVRGIPSFQWMKARLAHACKLDGLAEEILQTLLDEHPRPAFLYTQAEWLQQKQQWVEACEVLQQAMDVR